MSHRLQDEDGVTLVMALGFLALFGLLIPALLSLASANLLATSRLHEQRAVVYAADGATDGALQYTRTHPGCGHQGTTCSYQVTLNGKYATTSISFGGYDSVCTAPDYNSGATPVCHNMVLTTTVDDKTRVTAQARLWDTATAELPIDVLSWVYRR